MKKEKRKKYVYSVFETKAALDYLTRFAEAFISFVHYGLFSDTKMPRHSEEEIRKAQGFFDKQREKRRQKELECEITPPVSFESKKEEDESQESEA